MNVKLKTHYEHTNKRSLNILYVSTVKSYKHHTDLKAVLSNGNISLISGLDRVSKHLGLPGKAFHSGKVVWDLYLEKEVAIQNAKPSECIFSQSTAVVVSLSIIIFVTSILPSGNNN